MEKPKLDIGEVSQTIDLEELTGLDLSDHRDIKESIGQAIIDKIVERTKNGVDLNGRALKSPYSKKYTQTLEFKAAGKTRNDVNLTLTGDMLGTMQVDASDDSTVTISIDPDEAPKAYNHCVGDTLPKRNFFGVLKKDMNRILESFADDLDAIRSGERDGETNNDKLNLLDLLNGVDDEDED